MRLRYTPEAKQDLLALQDYIANTLYNSPAAERIVRSITASCSKLKQYPKMGTSMKEKTGYDTDLRLTICKHHVVVYRLDNDVISVARILNERQDYIRVLLGD